MTTMHKLIQPKMGLLKLAEKLGNVSEACKVLGYSRDSFYRFQKLYEEGGELALKEISRSKPLLKNRIEKEIEDLVVAYAVEQPAYGQQRASNELRKKGTIVSPSTIRCVWLRQDLETFQKRLKALEAKVAQDSLILTDAKVAALERKKEEEQSKGEIETHHQGEPLFPPIFAALGNALQKATGRRFYEQPFEKELQSARLATQM